MSAKSSSLLVDVTNSTKNLKRFVRARHILVSVVQMGLLVLQGVASIVMGMRNETLETELVPINEHNNATWPHPPVLFLRARHDQLEVQEALDITIPTYEEQVQFLRIVWTVYGNCTSTPETGLGNEACRQRFLSRLFCKYQRKGIHENAGIEARERGFLLSIWPK